MSVPQLQPKLKVGSTNDRFEREADRVADTVMRMSGPDVQRKCAECEEEEEMSLQRKGNGARSDERETAPPVVGEVLAGSGQPLDSSIRSFMEPRFGYDFSRVRVHTGDRAAESASSVNALAYTVGNSVVFGRDAYRPESSAGRRLIAHELTHVVQQRGMGRNAVQRLDLPDLDDLAERGGRFVDRQRGRAGRYYDSARKKISPTAEKAKKVGAGAAEELGEWWNSGIGDISQITFDGSTVELHGMESSYSAKAISGLLPGHPNIKKAGLPAETDCTKPEYQHLPDVGPIPAGEYILNPAEVQSNPPHKFNTGAWGKYRTRLHETLGTRINRSLYTDRTGGFYIHEDANDNGTSGCIGLRNAKDNKEVHRRIAANALRIPVKVKYSEADSEEKKEGAGVLQRTPESSPLAGEIRALSSPVIQREGEGDQSAARHYLIEAGIEKIRADESVHGAGKFPSDYYERLARHLFEKALTGNNRDYGKAFSELDDLGWGKMGAGLRKEYEKVVGTDNTNGWDKFRHFTFTAYLQYVSGGLLLPEVFTYGKEIFDELENWVGEDPEGYSVPDVRADNKGEAFAEEMRAREKKEQKVQTQKSLRDAKRVFIDQDPSAVMWFIQNLGR